MFTDFIELDPEIAAANAAKLNRLHRSQFVESWSYYTDNIFVSEIRENILNRLSLIVLDEDDDTIDLDNLASSSHWWGNHHSDRNIPIALQGIKLSYSDRKIIEEAGDLLGVNSLSTIAMGICILLAFRDDPDMDRDDKLFTIAYFDFVGRSPAKGARKIDMDHAFAGIQFTQELLSEDDRLRRFTKASRYTLGTSFTNVLSFKGRLNDAREKLYRLLEDGVDDMLTIRIVVDKDAQHVPGLYWHKYDIQRIGNVEVAFEWYKSAWSGNAAFIWKSDHKTPSDADTIYDKFGITNPKDMKVVDATAASWVSAWG